MRDFKRLVKGVLLKDNNLGPNAIGDLSATLTAADNGAIYNYQNKLKAFLDAAEREIITNNQIQTLENKTLENSTIRKSDGNVVETDAEDVSYDNTKVVVAGYDLRGNLQDALDDIKQYLDDQNDADEIRFDPSTSSLTAEDVQAAIVEVQENLEGHINETIGAHAATAISTDNSGNSLTSVNAQTSFNEVAGRLDTVESNVSTETQKVADLITLSGVAANSEDLGSFTGDVIPDDSTVKGALQSLETEIEAVDSDLSNHISDTEAHGATGAVVGTTNTQTLTNKTLQAGILTGLTLLEDYISEESENSDISGASAVIASPTKPIVRLTNASLISVTGISALPTGGVLTVVNVTGNDVEILNNAGVATEAILTGTDDDITLSPDAAILLKYDTITEKFRVIGGTGSGSVIIKALAGENLLAREAAYLSVGAADGDRTAGHAYKLDAANDNRIEYVGLIKDDVNQGNAAKIITGGVVKGFTGLDVGVPVWLNALNPGQFTQVEPTENQRWVIRLGIAISSTQVMILQDQGMTAFFNEEVQADITINNNVSSPANVSNLVFDGAVTNRFIVDYGLFRSTDTDSLAQAGRLRGVYNEDDAQWYLSDDYSGQNAGVTFSITAGGQIQYTSSDLTGTGYVGTLQYRISIGDGVHVLGVMEADGDLITRISGVNARLPIGAAGTAVVSNGTLPVYGYPDQLSTASGDAPSYSARAWVNFNGTGTVAIRASGNVSSITDNGTGDYTVNFTTAMPDANYSLSGMTIGRNSHPTRTMAIKSGTTPSTTSCQIITGTDGGFNTTGFAEDCLFVCVQVFR